MPGNNKNNKFLEYISVRIFVGYWQEKACFCRYTVQTIFFTLNRLSRN